MILLTHYHSHCLVLEHVVVPDALVKELATLRFGFAKLLHNYEKQLCHSPEAQKEFVEFLPRLFPNVTEHSSFQSALTVCMMGHYSTVLVYITTISTPPHTSTHYLWGQSESIPTQAPPLQ